MIASSLIRMTAGVYMYGNIWSLTFACLHVPVGRIDREWTTMPAGSPRSATVRMVADVATASLRRRRLHRPTVQTGIPFRQAATESGVPASAAATGRLPAVNRDRVSSTGPRMDLVRRWLCGDDATDAVGPNCFRPTAVTWPDEMMHRRRRPGIATAHCGARK